MSVIQETVLETEIVERFGEIVEATTVDYPQIPKTQSFAREAIIDAIDEAGVAKPGDPLDVNVAPNVKVVERRARIVGLSPDGNFVTVRVEIHYEQQRPETEQDFALRGGATLTQIETSRDRDGNLITVEHEGDEQTARVTVPAIQGNFEREVELQTNDPDDVVAEWVNHVNSTTFRGAPAGHWLCSNVTYDLLDRTTIPKTYRFVFAFERADKAEGHVYTVAYEDENGNIPPGLVEGQGIKDVDWHFAADFGQIFA